MKSGTFSGVALVFENETIVALFDLNCRWMKSYGTMVTATRALKDLNISLSTADLIMSPSEPHKALMRFDFLVPETLNAEDFLQTGFEEITSATNLSIH